MCGSLFLNDFVCFPVNFNEVPLILKKEMVVTYQLNLIQ